MKYLLLALLLCLQDLSTLKTCSHQNNNYKDNYKDNYTDGK